NVTYTPGAGDACAQAELAGLQCVAQRGSFAQLRVHDRPALLLLGDEQGGAHQVVLTALDGDTARPDIGGAEHTVGNADPARYWFGAFVVWWRPIALPVRALAPGMAGDSVLQLGRSLEQVAGLSPADASSDRYDASLVRLVEDFQRSRRLHVDGIAGLQTQLA